MTADPYRFWYAALALVGDCGKLTREQVAAIGPVHEDQPRPGFYRKPLGRKPTDGFLPVAIWISDEGEFVALEDGLYADPFDVWTWVCRHPVTEATYYASLAGEAWPKREDAA